MKRWRRPFIPDQRIGVGLGVALVVGGFVVLHDAYDGHGQRKPILFGPFLPW